MSKVLGRILNNLIPCFRNFGFPEKEEAETTKFYLYLSGFKQQS